MNLRKSGWMVFLAFFSVCPFLQGQVGFLSYQYVDSTASKVSYGWDKISTDKILAKIEKLKAELAKDQKKPQSWFNLADEFYHFRKLEEAEQCFVKVLQLSPNFFEARLGLAVTYYDSKRFNEAASLFSDCLKLNPKSGGCYNMIGNCYFHLKQMNYARDQYIAAAKFPQVGKFAHFNLGFLALQFGERFEAQKEIEILGKIDEGAQADLITEYNIWAQKKQIPLYTPK